MLDAVALAKVLATVPLVSIGGPWHPAIDQEYLTMPPPGFPAGDSPQPLWPGGANLAIRSYSAKNEGAGTILAVFTDRLRQFPPSFVEMIDLSGKLMQRLP